MGDSDPLTTDELSACFNVYSKVMASHYKKESGTGFADVRLIVALTLINKCRVEKAVQQYGDFVKKVLKPYDIDVDTSNLGLDGSEDSVLKIWRPQNLPTFFRSYRLCGKDEEGCEIFWIAGGTIQKHEEKAAVHASVLLFLAVYGDLKTLREGITFVIDVTKKDIHAGKVGNERKLQETWQAFPLRPRHFFIAGASFIKRAFLNALLRVASTFARSNKVLQRIKFVQLDYVESLVGSSSMPRAYDESELTAFAVERLQNFPGAEQLLRHIESISQNTTTQNTTTTAI